MHSSGTDVGYEQDFFNVGCSGGIDDFYNDIVGNFVVNIQHELGGAAAAFCVAQAGH